MTAEATTQDLLGSAREMAVRLRHELARAQVMLVAMSAATDRDERDELDVLAEIAEAFVHPSLDVPEDCDIAAWATEQLAVLARREQIQLSTQIDS